MTRSTNRTAGTRRSPGFTLLELSVAVLVATVIGGAGVLMMKTSNDSSDAILTQSRANGELRKAGEFVALDLQQASATNLTITSLTGGNHSITLRKPVAFDAGVVTWGVQEKELGHDSETRTREGWSVRYTVKGTGTTRVLVRQILDDLGTVILEKNVLRSLRAGSVPRPGFKVTASGSMWKLELGMNDAGQTSGTAGYGVSFDIAMRN